MYISIRLNYFLKEIFSCGDYYQDITAVSASTLPGSMQSVHVPHTLSIPPSHYPQAQCRADRVVRVVDAVRHQCLMGLGHLPHLLQQPCAGPHLYCCAQQDAWIRPHLFW